MATIENPPRQACDTPSSRWSALARNIGKLIATLPRPLRFLSVGSLGLATDISTFTLISLSGTSPLGTRLVSLGLATLVTWRFNRAITFDRSGRYQAEEALRYALVTAVAQGTSYAVFAVLVLTSLASMPQVAILAGAAMGAVIAYTGHRLFAFAPRRAVANKVAFARSANGLPRP